MCCTHTTGTGKLAGKPDSTVPMACGPPVEAPMATMRTAPPAAGAGISDASERRRKTNTPLVQRRACAKDDTAVASGAGRRRGLSSTSKAPASRSRRAATASTAPLLPLITTTGRG
jgi:hypothetical protein